VGEEVSGLQFDVTQGPEAEDCADQPDAAGRQNSRSAQGCSLKTVIDELNPILRGWMAYFKLAEAKQAWKELDG
jgi:hypothetical protein